MLHAVLSLVAKIILILLVSRLLIIFLAPLAVKYGIFKKRD